MNEKTGKRGQNQKYRMMDFILQVCKDNDDMLSCITEEKTFSFQHDIEIEMCDLELDSQEDGETISDHSNS